MSFDSRARCLAVLLAVALAGCSASVEPDEVPVVDLTGGPAFPLEAHLESAAIAAGDYDHEQLFEAGRELFHTPYNGLDGVGISRLPDGTPLNRFSVPPTGGKGGGMVSSQSCVECHNHPAAAAAGLASTNRALDLNKDGLPPFVQRSTTSLWGNGVVQLLAQEITEDLQAIRDEALTAAGEAPGTTVERALESKGISYGKLAATASASGETELDLSGLEGIDVDLVVRPLLWKGLAPTVRTVTLGASAGLMGMLAEEITWFPPPGKDYNPDPDGDGVEREFSVGDVTAMAVYTASQETPESIGRLAELGLVAAPDAATVETIDRGREAFASVGCADCHVPELHLKDTVFEEPTSRGNGNYYNQRLAGKDENYDPARPARFDLLVDAQEPRLEPHPDGGAIVRSYGDLKRHQMGRQLADPPGPQHPLTANGTPLTIDGEKAVVDPGVWLTAELWGVGSTGPWLHDSRAGTLDEAIRWHGEDDPPAPGDAGRSEAQESRDAYAALAATDREALLTFLRSLQTRAAPGGN
ncbi:MAG: hypothetical protein GTN89_02040 [Acidobacteria bacterium]|nr:hypothetical protein [Acidobacteriota bacterium]NIM61588.1 hypothetical protein [Acidobacteriota bacterium]NIO58152.1 hypothetical protein [Acidobacteriota bacterium]NIQ29168.1 hypothetical protein [Acidobacteriota bacterium]NIQ85080.1 hypothetical protein [Acidobacteriota bacterium]